MTYPKKIAFHTLGCKLNFSETSTIARLFDEAEFEKVSFTEKADVYIINTCSVTDNADKKCRQIVKKAIRNAPNAYVVVVGCYSQLKPDEIATIPGVDLILGTNEKFRLVEYLKGIDKKDNPQIHSESLKNINHFTPSYSLGDRTRSFLKIQDGCDYYCAYCTIPLARGKSRNATIKDVLNEAHKIALHNVKEIVLTGINIGDFGKSTGENFFELIRKLDGINGIERFRISSIEPNLLTDEILEFVAASDKFLPHFHIPLQSGNDKILALMKRKYQRNLFEERISKIKKIMPFAAIGTDVIVGFPGETDEDYLVTSDFIRDIDITHLHVFSYSERENTHAAKLGSKTPQSEINLRSNDLQTLGKRKTLKFYTDCIGREAHVLFEGSHSDGKISGFTENYIKTECAYEPLLVNSIKKVKLKGLSPQENMICELIDNDK